MKKNDSEVSWTNNTSFGAISAFSRCLKPHLKDQTRLVSPLRVAPISVASERSENAKGDAEKMRRSRYAKRWVAGLLRQSCYDGYTEARPAILV
jgi:hypothetical protein